MKLFIVFILLFITISVNFSQRLNSCRKFSMELYTTDDLYFETVGYLRVNYKINKKFTTGIYMGYDHYSNYSERLGLSLKSNTIHYGFSFKRYFLLQGLFFDPYLSGIVGMQHYNGKYSGYNENIEASFDWGFYGGLKTKIYKSLFVFAEGGYGDLGVVHLGVSLDL